MTEFERATIDAQERVDKLINSFDQITIDTEWKKEYHKARLVNLLEHASGEEYTTCKLFVEFMYTLK